MGNKLTDILDLKLSPQTKTTEIKGQIIGVEESNKSFLIANLFAEIKNNLLIITPNSTKADQLYEDLVRIIEEDKILLFPEFEIFPHESLEIEEAIKVERLQTLETICNKKGKIVIASIKSLLEVVMPCEIYHQYRLEIDLDQEMMD